MSVRIKIEGLRDPQIALAVAALGADAIGLVFAESPRRVTPEAARDVVQSLTSDVATIGVFVNADVDEINTVALQTGIGFAQLHGDEGPEMVGEIAIPCIKAFRVRDQNWLTEIRRWLGALKDRENLKAVLLDAYDPSARGGTGRKFNWQWIAQARHDQGLRDLGPIVLAGGLDEHCVAQAIEAVRPWAVDVASGVESSPGVKDLAKVKAFIQAVRAERPQSCGWDNAE